jgi:hypothetical protein
VKAKILLVITLGGLAYLLWRQLPDVKRYIAIERM